MTLIIADRVKETTTTNGTGALSLGGAVTGFRTFSSVCAVNDTCYYALQAVNGSGVPTGDWEVGLGTYSATNVLNRSTVLSSSNGGAAVSLASGTKQVWIDLAASDYANTRSLAVGSASGGPAFCAYATSTQTLSNNVSAKVTFDAEEYDTANCFASSRFTPNVAGYYQFNANAVLGGSAAYFSLKLYKNGTLYKQGMQHGSTSQSGLAAGISGMVYLNGSTDYVEIYAVQAGGSSVSTYVGSGTGIDVWFNGCRLA